MYSVVLTLFRLAEFWTKYWILVSIIFLKNINIDNSESLMVVRDCHHHQSNSLMANVTSVVKKVVLRAIGNNADPWIFG